MQRISRYATPNVVITVLGLVALAAMLYLVVISFSLSNDIAKVAQANLETSERAEALAKENTKRFCAIRQNADRQIAANEDFLREHPNGFAGVSVEEIQAGIDRMRDFRTSIGDLEDCPNGTEVPID